MLAILSFSSFSNDFQNNLNTNTNLLLSLQQGPKKQYAKTSSLACLQLLTVYDIYVL